MSPLQLYNTHTRAKQTFVPADPSGQVGLFVRGPTVYDLPRLGHAKTYTQLDFLVRLLRTRGFAVTYVQNITDVDDKIIRRARELRIDASDLARIYERAYLDDMRALRNNCVDVYARASDCVDQVISPAERLPGAYGLHTVLLTTSDPEMSTSLGNLVTIRDALATASARAIRFAFFSSHYRSPMELNAPQSSILTSTG